MKCISKTQKIGAIEIILIYIETRAYFTSRSQLSYAGVVHDLDDWREWQLLRICY